MAGLFGLFYTMFSIGVKGVGAVNDKIEDKNNKIKYHDEETDTYLDHRMVRRYMTFWKEELKGLSLPNFYGKSLSLYLLFDFNTKLPVRFTDRSIETIIGAYKGSIETVDKLFLLFKEDAIKEKEENYKKYNDRLKDMYTMRSRLEENLQDSVDAGMFITNIMNDRGK